MRDGFLRARRTLRTIGAGKNQLVETALNQNAAGKFRAATACGPRGEMNHLLHVHRGESGRAAAQLLIEAANQALGQGAQRGGSGGGRQVQRREQVMNANSEFSAVWSDERAEAILHQRAPENFLFTC